MSYPDQQSEPVSTAPALPDRVRNRALSLGPVGAEWLADLPERLATLSRDWSVVLGEPISGGSASLVLRARDTAGRPVVVKIGQPDTVLDDQADTLDRAAGRGYARLLAHDRSRNALLLEGLGPSLESLGQPPEQTLELLCDLLREAWQVPRPIGVVRPEPDKATALAAFIEEAWPALGRPCPRPVIDRALRYAERRAAAFDFDRSVVVHGDPHAANALRTLTPRAGVVSGFVFVDPDGFLDDPAYDLGVVLRDWHQELIAAADPDALLRGHCRLLADRSGIEPARIWEWGFLERVSSGLYCLRYGAPELGRALLATAGRLA
ncbi:aminoglycoside phosphotransferase family protein [Microlunatus speluncae]|uniref:aminoglycoside phosphotransferase family protein n=1 Tax=Microlunatus speluncae TaxID=2594267 RepID=UPI001266275C|nr:aminoglycoside phosphotransferase family protein [Microlunatus speluncae]